MLVTAIRLLCILPLLFVFSACSEGILAIPSPLQTPVILSGAADDPVSAVDAGSESSLPASTVDRESAPSDVTVTGPTSVETVANISAYLYTGPGRFYEEVGTVFPGKALRLIGQDAFGDWYQLDDARWINALAVRGRPTLPVASEITGRVVAQVLDVLDGDTIAVSFNDREYEVRYLLSVAPQVEQAFGREAYEWNRDWLTGKTVLLEADLSEIDAYGRLLRYVYLSEDGSMVNEELLRAGLAQIAVFPPADRYVERLRRAQAEAEVARRGLWSAEAIPYREDLSGCTYTVQPGESLQVIARRFGLLPDSLAEANEITDFNFVPAGASLTIPGCGVE